MDVEELIDLRKQLEKDIAAELSHYIQCFEGATGVGVSAISIDFACVSTMNSRRSVVTGVTVKLELE